MADGMEKVRRIVMINSADNVPCNDLIPCHASMDAIIEGFAPVEKILNSLLKELDHYKDCCKTWWLEKAESTKAAPI